MFQIIVKKNIISHTKTASLSVMIGLTLTLSGCSAVMSPQDGSYVGAVADYTPFDMGDDGSIFGNDRSQKPAFLQKVKTSSAQTTVQPTQSSLVQAAPSPTLEARFTDNKAKILPVNATSEKTFSGETNTQEAITTASLPTTSPIKKTEHTFTTMLAEKAKHAELKKRYENTQNTHVEQDKIIPVSAVIPIKVQTNPPESLPQTVGTIPPIQ